MVFRWALNHSGMLPRRHLLPSQSHLNPRYALTLLLMDYERKLPQVLGAQMFRHETVLPVGLFSSQLRLEENPTSPIFNRCFLRCTDIFAEPLAAM